MNEEIIIITLTLNHQYHTAISHHLVRDGYAGGGRVVGGVPNE